MSASMSRRSHVSRGARAAVMATSLAVGTVFAAHAHGNVRHDFKLVNGLWWNGRACVPRTVFTVSGTFKDTFDGRVEATLDLHGECVIPPFADAHNHGFAGFGDQRAAIDDALRLGVYYVKNPNNLASFVEAARTTVNQPRSLDVAYANGGLTASGGHPAQIYDHLAAQLGKTPAQLEGDAYVVIGSAADLDAKWTGILARKPDFIKVYLKHSEEFARRRSDPAFYGQRGLDPVLLPRIVERAHSVKLRVTAHAESAADFRCALAAGVDEIAHLPLAPLLEADARAAAERKIVVVTTTLSHWDTSGVADLDALHRANLELLQGAGVALALGTDGPKTVLDEADNIRRLAPFDDRTLLGIALNQTARTIFPGRRIGCLEAGCEASFLALDGDPLEDWGALRRVVMRMKQGFVLELKPQIATALQPIVENGSGAEVVAQYRRLTKEKPAAYETSESVLNHIGYQFLASHRAADAVAVLRLNAELYASSANAFDSLAEACEAARDAACVRQASERVLQLLGTESHLPDGLRKALDASARRRLQSAAAPPQ
jgi:hypothetical protein